MKLTPALLAVAGLCVLANRPDASRRAHARRLRQLPVAAPLCVLAAAAVFRLLVTNHQTPVTAHQSPGPSPSYELITEEQLLAAWGDRPVLILPDEPPGRRLVLLDR